MDLAITTADPLFLPRARQLAGQLGIPLLGAEGPPPPLVLQVTARRLELRQTAKHAPGPVYVDFSSAELNYRRRHGGGSRQSLAKAVGLKPGWRPSVLDATAGLGRDAFILATLGCRVQLLERSPLLHALLADGLQRGLDEPEISQLVRENMVLVGGDAINLLRQSPDPAAQVIYLDPMFPERSKSSLVKKEMRLLRQVVGDDPDAGELLELALTKAENRVVVKRPRPAPCLTAKIPSFSLSGKSSRFDIYLTDRELSRRP